jgi:hypothetical protein
MVGIALSEKKEFSVYKDVENGIEVLKISDGVKSYRLNSSYNPLEIAEKKLKSLKAEACEFVVLFGLGMGYEVEALLKIKKENSKVLCIEPIPQAFEEIPKSLILKAERNGFVFLVSKDTSILKKELKKHFINLSQKNPLVVSNPAYEKIFPEYFKIIVEVLTESLEMERTSMITKKVGEHVFTNNIFENLAYLSEAPDISRLFGKFSGYPAVVVSAGPSLKKQLKTLKSLKNRAVIICVDTALRVLKEHDITPDIVVSIDFTPVNYKHFENLDTSDYVYAFASIVYPKCIVHHSKRGGKYFSILNDTHLKEWISEYIPVTGILPVGDSTSHAAFHLAEKMGCDPIALIGQDLAYGLNETHCEGVATRKEKISGDDLLEVDGYYGSKVKTSPALFTILKHFEDKISESSCKVFNCTEGGAGISGAENISFDDFKNKYALGYNNFEEIIKKTVEKNGFFDYDSFLKDWQDIYSRNSRAGSLAVKGIKNAVKLLSFLCEGDVENIKKSDKISEEIYNKIVSDYIIMKLLQADIETSLYSMRQCFTYDVGIAKHDMLEEIQKDKKFFEKLLMACVNFRNCMLKIRKEFLKRKNCGSISEEAIKILGEIK